VHARACDDKVCYLVTTTAFQENGAHLKIYLIGEAEQC